jgi:S1-like
MNPFSTSNCVVCFSWHPRKTERVYVKLMMCSLYNSSNGLFIINFKSDVLINSCVKGNVPQVGDRVVVEASYNASMPFKWNATRVQLLTVGQVC